MRRKVTSREYKIMLNKERFIGSEDVLLERAKKFWGLFKDAIDDRVLDTDKSLNKIKKRRTIRFYDSEDRRLRANNYAFRERIDLSSGHREVTLKFRHPDRYVAQDRNMHATDRDEGETKFEEDIKPPFENSTAFLPSRRSRPARGSTSSTIPADCFRISRSGCRAIAMTSGSCRSGDSPSLSWSSQGPISRSERNPNEKRNAP
jgi:hypothetical protein